MGIISNGQNPGAYSFKMREVVSGTHILRIGRWAAVLSDPEFIE